MSQNCTTWEGGSLGSGDLNSSGVVAYVVATTTEPADPTDVDSTIQEHDDFDFFGLDLSSAHSDSYSSYISGAATSTAATSTVATTSVASTTSAAPTAVQTEVSFSELPPICHVLTFLLPLVRPG